MTAYVPMSKKHLVAVGEGLSSIGFAHGFNPLTLWNHTDNAALKSERQSPDILRAGDVVTIPDKERKDVRGATGKRHVFRRRGVPAQFNIRLLDDGQPLAGTGYTLAIDALPELNGTTDAAGYVRAYVPPDAVSGILTVAGVQYTVRFGGLDPIGDATGVRHRLANLGFDPGSTEDELTAALKKFQERAELPATGLADDATRDLLQSIHDAGAPWPGAADAGPHR
jgi:hypothetical protein